MARSIFSRKLDMLYLVFFIIHLPVMFCVDLTPLYPAALKPAFLTALRTWYISTYRDAFFIAPPAWFNAYMWMELVYHVPISLWAIGALVRDDARVPLHLLVWAVQTGVTTATCVVDYLSWEGYSAGEKLELGKLYVPYLALAVFMGVDMFGRLSSGLSGGKVPAAQKKQL